MMRAMWIAIGVAVAFHLGGVPHALSAAAILVAASAVPFVRWMVRWRAVPLGLEVRVLYLVVLAAGTWPPLTVVTWLQLAATGTIVAFDYCPFARILVLMPWHRTRPLTWALVYETFVTRPLPYASPNAAERRDHSR